MCRIYEHIYGNVERKDMDFQKVIEENFGHKKLYELILMVHEQEITAGNAKQVMMAIIDGDSRMPSEIAEEQGFMGGPITSDEVKAAVTGVLNNADNAKIIDKIINGNGRPVMALVGQVMRHVNRKGDPVAIKKLLEDEIQSRKSSGNYTAPKDEPSE